MEQIKRIEAMERLLDEVLAAESPQDVQEQLAALEAYYFGPLWLEDYAADEAGLLPRELKRGVLAQDTLYNLLTDAPVFGRANSQQTGEAHETSAIH